MKAFADGQALPILLNLIASFAGAFGQYFYKVGAGKMKTTPLLLNWPIFLGVILFSLVMVFFVWGFRLGGRISVTFPVYSLTFIWGIFIGKYLEQEPVSLGQLAGCTMVVIGIGLACYFSPGMNH